MADPPQRALLGDACDGRRFRRRSELRVGGTGKTRLALRVASAARHRYAHGAWLVSLAPISDPERVAAEVARALRIRERPGWNALDTLRATLSHRQLLLVLDNGEHPRGSGRCAQRSTGAINS